MIDSLITSKKEACMDDYKHIGTSDKWRIWEELVSGAKKDIIQTKN